MSQKVSKNTSYSMYGHWAYVFSDFGPSAAGETNVPWAGVRPKASNSLTSSLRPKIIILYDQSTLGKLVQYE